jgi:hypothetical protein
MKERGNEDDVGVEMGIAEAEFSASCAADKAPLESVRCSFIKCMPFLTIHELGGCNHCWHSKGRPWAGKDMIACGRPYGY